MNFLKKHYLKIIIVILILFSMNSCIKSCSRGNEIKKYEYTVDSLNNDNYKLSDSLKTLNNIITIKDVELSNLKERLNEQKQTNNKLLNRRNIINIKNDIHENKETK